MAEPEIGDGSIPSVGAAPIPLFVSRPASLLFHWLQPHELEQLMHVERPFSLAIASATTGYALGALPLLHDAFRALETISKVAPDDMFWHLVYSMMFALSVGISLIAWVNAVRGRSAAVRLLEEIKKRPQSPISPALTV